MTDSVEQIYKEYYDRLFTLALRVTGEQSSAEDVIQNAFVSAINSWDKFEKRSSYYTWLYAIVLNSARKFIKDEKPLPVDVYAEEHDMSIDSVYKYIGTFGELPEDHAAVNQVRETCLQMFLNCLPAKYRIVYTLRVILGCNVKESAEIIEATENSVKIDLSRAKEMLRNHFHGRCSLINKSGKCRCRNFAAHVMATGKEKNMFDLNIIKMDEKNASRTFKGALKEVLDVESLYDTSFKSIPFSELKECVMKIMGDGNNALLS